MLQENAFMRSLVHMNNLMLHFSLSGMMVRAALLRDARLLLTLLSY